MRASLPVPGIPESSAPSHSLREELELLHAERARQDVQMAALRQEKAEASAKIAEQAVLLRQLEAQLASFEANKQPR